MRLGISEDRRLVTVDGVPTRLLGFSEYQLVRQIPESWLDRLQRAGVNLQRRWICPIPRAWSTPGTVNMEPYRFKNGRAALNPPFWRNASAFITAAEKRGIIVLVDLCDRYGATPKEFSTNPLNAALGGPLHTGLPQLYSAPEVIEMIRLGASRLAEHSNVILQVCNEPGGYADIRQVTAFHRKAIAAIRSANPQALIAINPVLNAQGLPLIPDARKVGAQLVTIHNAGLKNPAEAGQCRADWIARRAEAIWKLLQLPVVLDTDGLHQKSLPCCREKHEALIQIVAGARGAAGVNHRGTEPPEPVDEKALAIIGGKGA